MSGKWKPNGSLAYAENLQAELDLRGWTHARLAAELKACGYKISRQGIDFLLDTTRHSKLLNIELLHRNCSLLGKTPNELLARSKPKKRLTGSTEDVECGMHRGQDWDDPAQWAPGPWCPACRTEATKLEKVTA